jgi:hypothetical protein
MNKKNLGTLVLTVTLTTAAQALPSLDGTPEPQVSSSLAGAGSLPPPVPFERGEPPAVTTTPSATTTPFAFFSRLFGGSSSSSPVAVVAPHTDPECDPNAPLQCREPVTAVCNVRKPEDRIPQMEAALKRRFFPRQHRNQRERLASYMGSAREAENQVFSQSPVTRQDLESMFNTVKANLRGLIAENPNIPANERQSMFDQLGAVQFFVSGSEYMASELVRRRAENTQSTDEQHHERTVAGYDHFCGLGLGANALNRGNKIHICPGLLQSLIDRRTSREETLNALAFTMGHELSHSIGPSRYPQLYQRMGDCYNQLNNSASYWNGSQPVQTEDAQGGHRPHPGRAEEIAADYWGTQILAQRMGEQGVTGDFAVRTVAHATDGFCGTNEPGYADGNDRIGQTVVRHPTVRQALGCGDQPARASCSMAGMHR